jgi:hypothetical protein
VSLLILASQVAGITSLRHWSPGSFLLFKDDLLAAQQILPPNRPWLHSAQSDSHSRKPVSLSLQPARTAEDLRKLSPLHHKTLPVSTSLVLGPFCSFLAPAKGQNDFELEVAVKGLTSASESVFSIL